MIRNYLKIAIRNLFRHKLFSFINVFGLALSMSICLLVLMRLKDQTSYDNFHPHSDRVYRIISEVRNPVGDKFRFASSPLPIADKLEKDYELVEASTRLYPVNTKKASISKREFDLRMAFTDGGFFKIFGFKLKNGNPSTSLDNPNSIILSEETATKFFGEQDPIGQIIKFKDFGEFIVTGLLEKPIGKSHIEYEAYTSLSSLPVLEKSGKLNSVLNNWDIGKNTYTYIRLRPNATRSQLSNAIGKISMEVLRDVKLKGKENLVFRAQAFDDIILGEELMQSIGNVGTMSKVWAEIGIGLIILLSACFNYTNLSIARSLKRGKEVGIRKVSGAGRSQVFLQFILESTIMAILALGLACVMLQLMIDHAPFGDEMLPAGVTLDFSLVLWFFAFSLFTGLLAGSLPAWALSSFKAVEVLKNLTNIKLFFGNGFRKSLIVVQFALALITTTFTMVFAKQFEYMATKDPGFQREHILNIPIGNADYKLLAQDISQLNGIVSVSASSNVPGRGASGRSRMKTDFAKEPYLIDHLFLSPEFIRNFDLKLLAGTTFIPSANNQETSVILNERAVEALQLGNPSASIGKKITIEDSLQVQVAGVVSNFYYQGLEMPYTPLILRNKPEEFRLVNVRTSDVYPNSLLGNIEAIWKTYNPGFDFSADWLDEQLYARQGARSTVSFLGFLAFMAITIACMGLLGMVIYTTETRRKEIGIRKIMGANIGTIMTLVGKDFVKLIVIAGLLAIPISYVCSWFFLNMFANRIGLDVGLQLIGLAGIISIAMLTIGLRIYKVAAANPVESLRSE